MGSGGLWPVTRTAGGDDRDGAYCDGCPLDADPYFDLHANPDTHRDFHAYHYSYGDANPHPHAHPHPHT
jgi:hypothetical protein